MEPRTIAAIEIASSKIKGAVGAIGPDGRLSVLAVEEIPDTNNVRYGRIQNIREVSGAVNEIVQRLEASAAVAPRKITAMSLSLGGRSLSAAPARASLKFPHEVEITETQVQRLMYEATRDFMGDKNIEATVPRMFYVNNAAVRKAVGTFGETLRGEFMMLTCGKETRQNLDRLKFDTVDHENIVYELRPTAIGDLVLTPDERELGCALVDFGAETTTVSVYKDGTLAFLSTIPMGSRLITLDLMAGLGITEEAAENYKLTLGTLADNVNSEENPNAEEVNGYVRARAGEIAANILNQIELSGYDSESLSKIILVGGGAKLPEFAAQLGAQCKMPVRVASMPDDIAFRVAGRNNADNIDVVALLAAGAKRPQWNCLSEQKSATTVTADDEDLEEADEDEPEERIDVRHESVKQPKNAKQTPERRPLPDEDDDNLLEDDDDEEEYDDEKIDGKAQGRGFFGFGRRHREKEDEENELDVFVPEEEEEDTAPRRRKDSEDYDDPENDPDHFKQTKRVIGSIRDKFIGIFKSDDFDDDDDN